MFRRCFKNHNDSNKDYAPPAVDQRHHHNGKTCHNSLMVTGVRNFDMMWIYEFCWQLIENKSCCSEARDDQTWSKPRFIREEPPSLMHSSEERNTACHSPACTVQPLKVWVLSLLDCKVHKPCTNAAPRKNQQFRVYIFLDDPGAKWRDKRLHDMEIQVQMGCFSRGDCEIVCDVGWNVSSDHYTTQINHVDEASDQGWVGFPTPVEEWLFFFFRFRLKDLVIRRNTHLSTRIKFK